MKHLILPAFIAGMSLCAFHINHFYEAYPLIKEVFPPPKDLNQIIKEKALKYNFPPPIIEGIARQESSRDLTNTAKKYEAKFACNSVGIMQVMEYHAKKTCGFDSPSQIYGPSNIENNIDCGLQVLSDCRSWVSSHSKNSLSEKEMWTKTLNCYNGGSTYTNKVVARLGEYVFENLKKFS